MNARIMTVYGTRPEAIKVAPIIKAVEADPDLTGLTVVTGQHREMLDQVNDLFDITPDYDLDVMAHGQALSGLFARILTGLDPILADEKPDVVIVQGDTTTSTAAALAAFYRGIRVVHAEAGLRSGDLMSPFPEEANRKVTTQIASLHLAPTSVSMGNLLHDGVNPADVVITGNTVIDALHWTVRRPAPFSDPALEAVVSSGRRIILATTHRRENWGEAMVGVGRAIARIAEANPDVTVVLPIHKNPVVRDAVVPQIDGLDNVLVTEPLAYVEFARMMAASHLVLTDSGGVQEEAPSLGKPVLVMRDNTERPEAVYAGTVRLVGTDEQVIVDEVSELLHDELAYRRMANAVNPYGDGHAATRTVAAIRHMLGLTAVVEEFAA